jgi:hypothetical protein
MDSFTPYPLPELTDAWTRAVNQTVKSAGISLTALWDVTRGCDANGISLRERNRTPITILFDKKMDIDRVFDYLDQLAKSNQSKGWDVT